MRQRYVETDEELDTIRRMLPRRSSYTRQWGKRSGFHTVSRPVHQIDPETDEIIATFESLTEAAKSTGSTLSSICRVAQGKARTTNGFKWAYADKRSQ
jgi:hypothetical protein